MITPTELEGMNLGEKHRHFNTLVKEAIVAKTCKLDKFDADESDIENLLKIDIASNNRNVEYILKVLVCGDMLYVSRVIKQCQWLVTDVEYSKIISPEYLFMTLFPLMNRKSIIKFTKHIQLHLNDTNRAEKFYEYEKKPETAANWLPSCSSEFILQNAGKHIEHLSVSQIKRLCQKTILVLEVVVADRGHISKRKVFESVIVLLNSENINKYLDFVEKLNYHDYPKFGKAATNLLMKLTSKRIFDKFEQYYNFIHLPTFIKFLKAKNIRKFLLDLAYRVMNRPIQIFTKQKLLFTFLESMIFTERVEFIKQMFIDKAYKQTQSLLTDSEIKAMSFINRCVTRTSWFNQLEIYKYMPFDVALSHFKELINENPQRRDKNVMFSILITCAKQNIQDLNLLLQYFHSKHINAQYELRYQFIKDIISETNFLKFDQQIWNIVEDIMMLDIVNSDNKIQVYLEAIIIYKLLHAQTLPEDIENKFEFNSLNIYKNKLDTNEKDAVFRFLYNQIIKKLQSLNLENEQQFKESIKTLDKLLNLLNDWDKDLGEYPLIIKKIKEVIDIKKQNAWNSDMSFLYNKNKSWKKLLFEESFLLFPSEPVLINAIKHDSTMFERYKSEAEALCINEKETVIKFLRKVKIYWPQSFTKCWIEIFMNKLNDLHNQKASSRGICILLPRIELLTILNKYAPENSKIDYDNINELNLNLQRCFAKNMHIARPQPSADVILLYSKGDYLSYSLPSLLSIYYNLTEVESAKQISKLLNGQISLQKHAIRFAMSKMKTSEISTLFVNVWKSSQNSTIRSVLFKTVYNLLCKERDPLETETLWSLLEMFIDNLSFNENKDVYDTLLKIPDISSIIAAKFFVKSYTFLKSLHASNSIEYDNYDIQLRTSLFPNAVKVINALPTPFIVNMLLTYIKDDFINEHNKYNNSMKWDIVAVLTAYLLSVQDEETQIKRYEEVFVVLLDRFALLKENKNVCMKNLEAILDNLGEGVKSFYFEKKMVLPINMFTAIQQQLKKILSDTENYLILTKWDLFVAFTKSLNGHEANDWNELCIAASPQFGEYCYQKLETHCKKYFPRIYILFANALENILNGLVKYSSFYFKLKIYQYLLQDTNFIQGYLTALRLYPDHIPDNDEQAEKIRIIIHQHPSLEVKMYYHNKF